MDLTNLYFQLAIAVGDVVGDNKCIVCGKKGDVFCYSHFAFFKENNLLSLDNHMWFWYYHGKARDVVLDIKQNKRYRVAYRLGQYIGKELIDADISHYFDAITYVPHHPRELQKGMFSFPLLLAMGIADMLNIPLIHMFVKTRPHSQHVLSMKERKKLLKGVYNISGSIPKVATSVLIVDDIITTGSTLEYLKKLSEGGVSKKVYTLTLSKTPKWSDVI